MYKEIPNELIMLLRGTKECVLFVGAGMGEEIDPPILTGSKMAQALASHLGIPYKNQPLSELAQYYEVKNGGSRRNLIEWLRGIIKNDEQEPSPAHKLMVKLPFRYIVTTNYDTLIERAATLSGKDVQVAIRDIDFIDLSPAKFGVYKIHGTIQDMESIVITDDDLESLFEKRGNLKTFLKNEMTYRTFLFVGFSFRDWDFRIVHQEVRRNVGKFGKLAYAVKPEVNQLEYDYWRQKGIILIDSKAGTFFANVQKKLEQIPPLGDILPKICEYYSCTEKEAMKKIREECERNMYISLGVAAYCLCMKEGIEV